jgi:hypothetical protein
VVLSTDEECLLSGSKIQRENEMFFFKLEKVVRWDRLRMEYPVQPYNLQA